jgi:hypothetical protein
MRPDVQAIYASLNDEFFGNNLPTDLDVEWSDSLNNVASFVTVNGIGMPISIELNQTYFASKKFDNALITEAIAHAMTHLWRIEHSDCDRHDADFMDKLSSIIGTSRIFGMLQNDVRRNNVKSEPHLVQVVCPSHGILGTRARMPKNVETPRYHRGAGTGLCPHQLRFIDLRTHIPQAKDIEKGRIKIF